MLSNWDQLRFAQQQTAWLAVHGQASVDGTYEDTDGWSTQGNLSRMHPQRQQADGAALSATITAPATTSPRSRDRLRGLVEPDNRLGYAGYVWDPFLKLYHVRHRVYNAAQGV